MRGSVKPSKKVIEEIDIECVFFVSKYRDAYLLDFTNIIGLPNDFQYRLRYRKRWVDNEVKKGMNALIAFYNHDDNVITPIRVATITRDKIDYEPYKTRKKNGNPHVKVKIEESTFQYFVLSLGEFVGAITDDIFMNIQNSSQKKSKVKPEERYFVYKLEKKISLNVEPGMVKDIVKGKEDYIKPWVKIINDLSHIEEIKNGCFLKIFLIEKANFSNVYLKCNSKKVISYYLLRGGSEFRLVLEQYCPKFENIKDKNQIKVTYEIASSDNKHLEILKKEINLYRSGLYDFHEIIFRTKNVLKTKNELLIISPKDTTELGVPLPEFKLPIRIKINLNGILLITFFTLNALLAPVIIILTIINAQKPEASVLELSLIAIGAIIIGLSAILKALEKWADL